MKNKFEIEGSVLIEYNGTDIHVRVPDGVTAVGNSAFSRCRNIRSVSLPDSVEVIGDAAFCGCEKLTEINLPDGVTYIGDRAFAFCDALPEIKLPPRIDVIRKGMFYACYSLTSVNIPAGVTEIGSKAFYECRRLTSFSVKSQLTEIGELAFYGCSELASVSIPFGVRKIGSYAFAGCESLTSLSLPDSVEYLDYRTFYKCRRLKLRINGNPKGASDAFSGVNSITATAMPLSTFSTPDAKRAAVLGYLQESSLYDGVIAEEYRRYAVNQRKKLLPAVFKDDNVAALDFYARDNRITVTNFYDEYFTSAEANAANCCISFLIDWKSRNITFEDELRETERELAKDPFNAEDMKKLWSYAISPDGTVCLTSYKGCETEVQVPSRIGRRAVTALGNSVFAMHTPSGVRKPKSVRQTLKNITSVYLPDGIRRIGSFAFNGCSGIQSINIPDCVESVGECAFYGCKGLKDKDGFIIIRDVLCGYTGKKSVITVPDGITAIDGYAFYKNNSVTEVKLPKSVKEIRIGAFEDCGMLTTVSLPDELESIGDGAFRGCVHLYGITLPDSVATIGTGAFTNCRGLRDYYGFIIFRGVLYGYCGINDRLTVPDGVTVIEESAFFMDSRLVQVRLPESVREIRGCAFAWCSNLAQVIISEGTVAIDGRAFEWCRNLTTVIIPDTVTKIGSCVFSLSNNVTVCASEGSPAHKYAKENGIKFFAL